MLTNSGDSDIRQVVGRRTVLTAAGIMALSGYGVFHRDSGPASPRPRRAETPTATPTPTQPPQQLKPERLWSADTSGAPRTAFVDELLLLDGKDGFRLVVPQTGNRCGRSRSCEMETGFTATDRFPIPTASR